MKVLLILLTTAFVAALPQTYEEKGSKVFRITDIGSVEDGLEKLQHLQINEAFDFWTGPSAHRPTDIFVPPEKLKAFEKFAKSNGFTYTTLIEDVGKLMLKEKAVNKAGKEIDWDNYHRYDTILDFVQETVSAHSDIASVEEIGRSIEDRSIVVLKIGVPSQDKMKPAVFIDGGIHAREWISPALTTFFINRFLNNYTSYMDILNEVDIYILPVANPDGYEYSHTTNRMWRKNRRPDDSCEGVDLNRNFGFHWGGIGSSGNKCSEVYRGTSAFSEPESQAMRDFIERKKAEGVNWRAYYAIHSYGQMWLLPWGFQYPYPDDYEELEAFGKIGVEALTALYGTRYKIGTITYLLNPGAGGSDDWAKGSEIFKFVQTVEVRDTGSYGFLLPPDQIMPTALETWEAMKATLRFIAQEGSNSTLINDCQ